jgi:protein arginine kinase activator
MKCEICGKRESVVHVQQVIGNETMDLHLCEVCAHEKGISKRSDKVELSLSSLLTGLMDIRGEKQLESGVAECPTCGLKVSDFKNEGRLGCPDCYVSFAPEIKAVHKRLSGGARHKGKLPQKLRNYKELLVDRERLRGQLEAAVAEEDYETAAVLRDRIKAIENRNEIAP